MPVCARAENAHEERIQMIHQMMNHPRLKKVS